jgi:hypothetical protein
LKNEVRGITFYGNSNDRRRFKVDPHKVIIFRPHDIEVDPKIFIAGGPPKGSREVFGTSNRKVKLRCPISAREFE